MTADDRSERRIALAAVAGAHGVRGELRLKLFSDTGASLAAHKSVHVAGTERGLTSVRKAGKGAVVRLQGIDDRSTAESLRGSLIEVDRAALPALDEGEYYHADLIGLPAQDSAGKRIGTVTAVENFGAGDILEIEVCGKRSLIPFRDGVADLRDGRIIFDPDFLA